MKISIDIMNKKHWTHWSMLLSLAVFGLGCSVAVDETANANDGAEAVAEDHQALNGVVFGSWQKTNPSSTTDWTETTVPTETWTCFLSGVAGSFASNWPTWSDLDPPMPISGAWGVGTTWTMVAEPSTGQKIRTELVCVPTPRSSPFVRWRTGEARHRLGKYSEDGNNPDNKRRCFLTEISNDATFTETPAGSGPLNFASAADKVYTYHDDQYWYIAGEGRAAGQATCINISVDRKPFGFGVPGAGTATNPLAQNTAAGTVQCALTGVQGKFRTNSFSDGVFIRYSAVAGQWTSTETNTKSAWSQCFE